MAKLIKMIRPGTTAFLPESEGVWMGLTRSNGRKDASGQHGVMQIKKRVGYDVQSSEGT